MAHERCPKCNGTGFVHSESPIAKLTKLVEPFISDTMFGFRLKGESLEGLTKDINQPHIQSSQTKESFPEVVDRLALIE